MENTSVLAFLGHVADSSLVEIIVAFLAGAAPFFRGWLEWRRGSFESCVNISDNLLTNGVLEILTVRETMLEKVILSPYARRLVKKAAKKTTINDEFLHFENERDEWMVYNAICNAISSIYGAHLLSAVVNTTGSIKEPFVFALTWERDTEAEVQKLRVILVQDSVLREVGRSFDTLKPKVANQRSRIGTLVQMYEQLVSGTLPLHQRVDLPKG